MKNEIRIFNNPAFGEIRTIVDENDTPWFVGKDVAIVLGYAKPLDAIQRHIEEDDSVKHGLIDSLGRTQQTILINESGLYSLILSSKLPQAKEFKHWVTSEVLPTIRKHGAYMTDQTIEQALLNPDTVIKLATSLKEERQARLELQAKNEEQKVLIEEQKVQIADMTEKSIYCDRVLASKSLVTVESIAQDYGTTAKTFNKYLELLGIQWRRKTKDFATGKEKAAGPWNLYEEYKYVGYVQSVTFPIRKKDGTIKTTQNTQWTPLGVKFLYDKLKEHGALPIEERGNDYIQPYELLSSTPKRKRQKKESE